MKPACTPLGVSLKTPPFARLNKDELKATGEAAVAQAAAQPAWVLAVVGLAAVGVVGGATAGIVVAVSSGNATEVSPSPSPPPVYSPPS